VGSMGITSGFGEPGGIMSLRELGGPPALTEPLSVLIAR
jgi:hypothetical protein